ncbi:MAG: hydantoinase/oxoprolinase family protein, partial [Promethearchaeota archaeon]
KCALMADVYLILGKISIEEYDCETADGRSKEKRFCLQRLARIVCEDADFLSERSIIKIAEYLSKMQQKMIERGLKKVLGRLEGEFMLEPSKMSCVVTGLGEDILAGEVAKKFPFTGIMKLSDIIGFPARVSSSSIGVLHMLKTRLDGMK